MVSTKQSGQKWVQRDLVILLRMSKYYEGGCLYIHGNCLNTDVCTRELPEQFSLAEPHPDVRGRLGAPSRRFLRMSNNAAPK